MEFKQLKPEHRKILLEALDIDYNNLKCKFCNEKVNYIDCGIMPPINKKNENAVIICNSPLCISTYLTEIEDQV